ncbi:MAG: hypothetical protein COA79_03770 [Planctomycetota bacterium]|nr:MAG: hypothetical protein COA79_03770 [Planctomycetota bacterium]
MNKSISELLQLAYSAESAAAYAYQGHAQSVANSMERYHIHQIEKDEWDHRKLIYNIMCENNISISEWKEFKFAFIGKFISFSCFVIGWFLPMYFAGRLESGNVNEYLNLKDLFNDEGITNYDKCLVEMAIKEKEHELFFLNKISCHKLTPLFQSIFKWGPEKSFNQLSIKSEIYSENQQIT